jgi:hypothetical protein
MPFRIGSTNSPQIANMTLSDLVTTINSKRKQNNLSSAVRLFVLDHYRRQAVPLLRKRRRAKGPSRGRNRISLRQRAGGSGWWCESGISPK